jgi:hypothetical protein
MDGDWTRKHGMAEDWPGNLGEDTVQEGLTGPYDSWTIISKGQLMAAVGHTASQSVHQSHFTVSIRVMILLTIARASQ